MPCKYNLYKNAIVSILYISTLDHIYLLFYIYSLLFWYVEVISHVKKGFFFFLEVTIYMSLATSSWSHSALCGVLQINSGFAPLQFYINRWNIDDWFDWNLFRLGHTKWSNITRSISEVSGWNMIGTVWFALSGPDQAPIVITQLERIPTQFTVRFWILVLGLYKFHRAKEAIKLPIFYAMKDWIHAW